jgi:hypothetical protein
MDVWTIKPLEWTDSEIESTANTPFGQWQLVQMASGRWWFGTVISTYDRESAKRAVEAYYESRMKAGLVAVDVETLRKECGL